MLVCRKSLFKLKNVLVMCMSGRISQRGFDKTVKQGGRLGKAVLVGADKRNP